MSDPKQPSTPVCKSILFNSVPADTIVNCAAVLRFLSVATAEDSPDGDTYSDQVYYGRHLVLSGVINALDALGEQLNDV